MQPLDVLAIAAHRDDVEQTCGGTLLRMAEIGYRLGRKSLEDVANAAKSEEGLARAAEAWDRANDLLPRDKLLGWRRRAVGLN